MLVADTVCNECLYSKNRIVDKERADAILKQCEEDGSYFLCHKGTLAGNNVVCRRFFDEQKNQACQLAKRLGFVTFVDPAMKMQSDAGCEQEEPDGG